MNERRIVYEARLEVCQTCLIRYIDYYLKRIDLTSPSDNQWPAGLFSSIYCQKHGEELASFEEVDKEMNWGAKQHKDNDPIIYMHRFWDGDTQYTLCWTWAYGLRQFNGGRIVLQTKGNSDKVTGVMIISEWTPMLPYWEWVKRKLRENFKERHKGGPKSTPIKRKLEIVMEWHKVMGTQMKDNFCGNHGISVSGLRKWERELKELGLISES